MFFLCLNGINLYYDDYFEIEVYDLNIFFGVIVFLRLVLLLEVDFELLIFVKY